MKIRRDAQESKIQEPSPEMRTYLAAKQAQAEAGAKVTSLQKRQDELTAQSQELHTELEGARVRKAAAIVDLATQKISEKEYSEIKASIVLLNEKIGEISEMMTVIEKSLQHALATEISKAGLDVSNARFNVIRAHIGREAAELKEKVGEKVAQLACLAAQLNITGHGNCLAFVFPERSFNERIVMAGEELRKLGL